MAVGGWCRDGAAEWSLRADCSRAPLARAGRLVEADDGATFAQAVISCEPSTAAFRRIRTVLRRRRVWHRHPVRFRRRVEWSWY